MSGGGTGFTIGPRVERETLSLSYEGPALAAGSIDAKDLGAALVSVSDLCRRANELINGEGASLTVNVQARFERGSFHVPVEVVQTIAASLVPGEVKDVHYVLATLGLVEGKAVLQLGANLLKFVKWLHGKIVVDKTQPQNGVVTITAGDHSTTTVNNHVFLLADDSQIRRALTGIVRPLERSGVERVAVMTGGRIIESVTREEVPAIEAAIAPAPIVEPPLSEEERVAVVQVVKPAFRDNMSWEFSEGGTAHFPAVIEDESFLEQVRRRDIMFGAGDMLRVRLSTKKFHTATGLRSDVRVVKVVEQIPVPRQGQLPL